MRRALTWMVLVLSVLTLAAAQPPDDPFVPEQWHLPRVGTFDAWPAGRGGGVIVAVVDTGVDASHPDLQGRVIGGVDLVEPGTPPDDPNGHGTLVAGVLAATAGNGVGGVGVAPSTVVMPVRVLAADGSGSSRHVAEGIRWATRNGAHVINLSLAEAPGLTRGAPQAIGSDVEQAISEADARGVTVVAAAGNDGRSSTPYGASVPVLVVGASDRGDNPWAHSNRDARTLFAPGVEIVSTYRNHGYARADGTSFAAPIVSAGAALLRGAGLPADQVHRRLLDTAAPVSGGAGRVDLAAATARRTAGAPDPQAAQPPPPPPPPPPAPEPPPPPPPPTQPSPEVDPTVEPDPPPSREPEPVPVEEDPTPEPVLATPSPSSLALEIGADAGDDGSSAGPWLQVLAAGLLGITVLGHAATVAVRRQGDMPQVVWRR